MSKTVEVPALLSVHASGGNKHSINKFISKKHFEDGYVPCIDLGDEHSKLGEHQVQMPGDRKDTLVFKQDMRPFLHDLSLSILC